MIQVNISEAKAQLSKLIHKAAKGDAFIIAKAGKPLVKVVPYDVPKTRRLLGSMRDVATFDPDLDFKAIASDEIMEMFYGKDEK